MSQKRDASKKARNEAQIVGLVQEYGGMQFEDGDGHIYVAPDGTSYTWHDPATGLWGVPANFPKGAQSATLRAVRRVGAVARAEDALQAARDAGAARADAFNDALALVQHARELEARRGRSNALPEGAFALQRLLIAMLETLTPEQRAEVRRRLGE